MTGSISRFARRPTSSGAVACSCRQVLGVHDWTRACCWRRIGRWDWLALPLLLGITAAAIGIPATAAAIGYPIAFALKGFVRRSENLGQLTTVLGVVLGLAYVTLSVTGELLTVVERLEPVLQSPPVAWFGHLALVTTPNAGVDLTGPLVPFGLMPVLVIGGTVLAVPAARYAWLADTARASADEGRNCRPRRIRVSMRYLPLSAERPRRVASLSTTLRRAVRSPFQFVFVAPPLVAAIVFIEGL